MARFVKKRKTSVQDEIAGPSQEQNDAPSRETDGAPVPLLPHGQNNASTDKQNSSRGIGNSSQAREEINWEEEVEFDSGKRRCIDEYPPNLKDMVRRKYLANGPCQPRTCDFPATEICGKDRRDVAGKEQMAVVLRYVGKCGNVKERLVGLVHVKETTYKYLKSAIDALFAEYKLSFKQVRGQGYDGASNMRVVKVLEYVEEEDRDGTNRMQACGLLVYFQSFDFVFYLQLMSTILIITNTLSLALQRKDRDIVNAIGCVTSTKNTLTELRMNGWESVLGEAYSFCDKHSLSKLEMEDQYVNPKKPRQKTGNTNKHHYQVDCFNDVIDWLLQELDTRFNEKNSKIIICSATLSPKESFCDFNLENLMSLAKLYPKDFDDAELKDLRHHHLLYINDVRADDRFSGINNIFERCFSAMRIVKTYLRNRLSDDALKYNLICYVEKEEMRKVTNDVAIEIYCASFRFHL
ncbi:hypothetical protein ACQ4PT_056024 [Festuca glaucescens]